MRILKLHNTIWGSLLCILLILSVYFAFISTDAPFYLSISRDVANGKVIYKDIYNVYTPIMMQLNSLVYIIFDNPGYHVYLLFQYLIISVSTFFFYRICLNHEIHKNIAIFLSVFLFLSILGSDGTYIILEVYVIMFVFASYWFLQKSQFFLSGAILSLAFLSKQYGVLNFVPFFLLISTSPLFKMHFLFKFLIGASFPVFIFLGYYLFFQNIDLLSLYIQLTGQGYEQNMKDVGFTIMGFLSGAKIFILIMFPFLFVKIQPIQNRVEGILILGIILNLLPLIVQNFAHYFILTFPYVFILLAMKYQDFNKKLFYTCNIVLILISVSLFLRVIRYKDVYSEQLEIAKKYEEVLPKGSTVFLYKGYRYLYLLNDYQNPVLKSIGYSYGYKPDESFIQKYEVLMDEEEKIH